ncbi:M48 family metallopeptidase [Rhodanobacter lindaniclasticus]
MKHRYLLLSLAATLLGGCVTSPTGRSQLMMVSDSQMSQMGLTTFNDMRKQGKFVDAPRERAYATCVANALIAVLPRPWNTQQWEVQIVGDDTANAFALPGGRIGVNKGMFKIATDQNQLAVVLGHELSHVVARHGAERVSDNLATQAAVTAGTVYAGSRGGDANSAAALLGAGAELGILLPFSRTQESEADTLGQRYMAQAGFNPRRIFEISKSQNDADATWPQRPHGRRAHRRHRQDQAAAHGQRWHPLPGSHARPVSRRERCAGTPGMPCFRKGLPPIAAGLCASAPAPQ